MNQPYFSQAKASALHLKYNSAAKCQIRSFDDFILNIIPEVIEENKQIVVLSEPNPGIYHRHIINFENSYLSYPTLVEKDKTAHIIYPAEARARNLTYASSLYTDITITTYEVQEEGILEQKHQIHEKRVCIGRVPIMVGSSYCSLNSTKDFRNLKECMNDQGGYFIHKGLEKVIVAQERLAYNFVHVSRKKHFLYAEVRSLPMYGTKIASQLVLQLKEDGIRLANIRASFLTIVQVAYKLGSLTLIL